MHIFPGARYLFPELAVQLFTHKSAVNENIAGSECSNEELARMGSKIIALATMIAVIDRTPALPACMIQVSEMLLQIRPKLSNLCQAEYERILSIERVDQWVRYYSLRRYLHYLKCSVDVYATDVSLRYVAIRLKC